MIVPIWRTIPLFLQLVVPRRVPLFPYPTLFRSSRERSQPVVVGFLVDLSNATRLHWKTFQDAIIELVLNLLPGDGVLERDRKSTRLNSSHQISSYAVFCLKKKRVR